MLGWADEAELVCCRVPDRRRTGEISLILHRFTRNGDDRFYANCVTARPPGGCASGTGGAAQKVPLRPIVHNAPNFVRCLKSAGAGVFGPAISKSDAASATLLILRNAPMRLKK